MSTLRVVPERDSRHPYLVGLPSDLAEMESWARILVDPLATLEARQYAGSLLLQAARTAYLRLEACATGEAVTDSIISARERSR